jgi:hypothetical protein
MGGRGWALKKVAPTQRFFFQHIHVSDLSKMWVASKDPTHELKPINHYQLLIHKTIVSDGDTVNYSLRLLLTFSQYSLE